MKQRKLYPRSGGAFLYKDGRLQFYHCQPNSPTKTLLPPYSDWIEDGFYNLSDLVNRGWKKLTLEQFKEKFPKLPIFLNEEKRKEYLKIQKIKNYLIRKQKIMNGGEKYI